jgi:MobA-like NTP transferase domain
MRNTVSRSPRSMISNRSPIIPTKWGMSITASGSVQRTSSRSPGAKDFKALRVLSAGRGHFSPDRSNLMVVMARNVRIVGRQSIAPSRLVGLCFAAGRIMQAEPSQGRPLQRTVGLFEQSLCGIRVTRQKAAAMTEAFGVPGIVLAGGLAQRMGGGDKPLRELGGYTILARVIARLEPQRECLLLSANGNPLRFAPFGLTVLADGLKQYPGPLAGILAGLDWPRLTGPTRNGFLALRGTVPSCLGTSSRDCAKLCPSRAPSLPSPPRKHDLIR